MLIDYTRMNGRQATAVTKLMEVYAEHFPGEDFYIAENETTGQVYMGLENIGICPFVSGGDVFFEVFDFENGGVKEFSTVEEAYEHYNELNAISSDGREGR
jgi:FAD synthase